ncbi:MAG: hypothetical protein RLZZ387_1213 [Chloroflexota bacterium]
MPDAPRFALPGLMEIRSPKLGLSESRYYLNLRARLGEGLVTDVVLPGLDGQLLDLTGYTFLVALWEGGNDAPLLDVLHAEATNVDPAALAPLTFESRPLTYTTEEGETLLLTFAADDWRVRITASAADLDALRDKFLRWELRATPPAESEALPQRLNGYFDVERMAFTEED